MSEPIWNKFFTERDKAVFGASGYGCAAASASARRCSSSMSITRSAASARGPSWSSSSAGAIPAARSVGRHRPYQTLIDRAHEKALPVIYTTGVRRPDMWDSAAGAGRTRSAGEAPTDPEHVDGDQIVAEIAPGPKDIVIYKQKPSGFFGTHMAGYLTQLRCDSVIVTGTTTSGCVRATVLDAFSNNYRVALVEDGCFDRTQASHAITLCDMNAKYADVVQADEVSALFRTLRSPACLDLPPGTAAAAPAPKRAANF